jgi:hypothetical protein
MGKEKEAGEGKITVVTVRCIDMTAPFSDNWRRSCDLCGEMTWVSASWKGKKIDRIMCEHCWSANYKDKEEINICVTKASLNEFREWSKRYYGSGNSKRLTMKDVIKMIEMKTGKKIKIVDSEKEDWMVDF